MSTDDGVLLDDKGAVVGKCSCASIPVISLLEETQKALCTERGKIREIQSLWLDLCEKKVLIYNRDSCGSVIRLGKLLGIEMVVDI